MAKSGKGGPDRLLTLKGLTWWAKLEIPKDCRATLGGKTALPESMETGDIRQARVRRNEFESATKAIFASIRAGTYDPQGKVVASSARGALWRETLMQMRGDPDLPDGVLETAVYAEEAERDNLRGAERATYDRALRGVCPFDHHAPAYLKSIKLAEKTTKERAGLLVMVSKWFTQQGFSLDRIGRREIGRYCSEVLEELHPVTGKKRLGAAHGYWDWLMTKGFVPKSDGNPWGGQLKANKKRRVEREDAKDEEEERDFTDAEVVTLLASPWPKRQASQNCPIILDGLAMGLLSGLREAEVANLQVGDIVPSDGCAHGVLLVRAGKTASAVRRVPVHPAIAPMLQRRCAGKGTSDMVFHDLWEGRELGKGSAADTFGKAFRRYRLALGVDDKREGRRRSLVNFHSARRWFATKAAQADVQTDTIAALIGHSKKGRENAMTLRYIKNLTDDQLWAAVVKVQLPLAAAAHLSSGV
jgi:integrase